MAVLVTGGAGFIGRWVVARLLAEGQAVLALDDLSTGRRENLRAFAAADNFLGLREGDVKDREFLARLFREHAWDCVYHLAASIHVQRSIDDPGVTFANDVEGTFTLLEACREQYFRRNALDVRDRSFHLEQVKHQLTDRGPRLVLMSTCMVYARATDDQGIAEDHPLRPASPYAASKIAAESLALSYYHAYGMPVTVVRPFNTYGPMQKSNSEGGVVSIFLMRDLLAQPLQVKGDGTQTRDLLYVEDCAEFVVRAGNSDRALGQVINAGTGQDISIKELARRSVTGGNRVEHVTHDHPQAEIPRLLCNPARARELLDWHPRTTLEEGMRRTRAWLDQNRWAW